MRICLLSGTSGKGATDHDGRETESLHSDAKVGSRTEKPGLWTDVWLSEH